MPQRCSIPGCGIGYKKGLKLLCYPKHADRRAAWLQSLANAGVRPTNHSFICEKHFGPNQWEKVRVDGTRKLKWQGVPDILMPTNANSTSSIVLRKRIKLRSECPDGQDAVMNSTASDDENIVQYPSTSVAKNDSKFSILQIPAKALSPSLKNGLQPSIMTNLLQRSHEVIPMNDNVLKQPSESVLELKKDCRSVIIKLPAASASQYHSSLLEDLDDVRSFLNMTERTYEDRLVKALAELVKKHQLLDEKLKRAESILTENLSLKKQINSFNDILAENRSLRDRLRYLEKAVDHNKTPETPPGLGDFVSLEDQL